MKPLTITEWADAEIEADKRMKADNGHSFITILKTRCQYCGKSPAQARNKKCQSGWFHCYRHHLGKVLQEKGIIN